VHKLRTGSALDFPGAKSIPHDAVLELELDVLYPAALENSISEKNAHKINARIICELSNDPTTPEADLILVERHIFVIPDILLASAVGVTVSYFEMVQNSGEAWDEQTVHTKLDNKISKAFKAFSEA